MHTHLRYWLGLFEHGVRRGPRVRRRTGFVAMVWHGWRKAPEWRETNTRQSYSLFSLFYFLVWFCLDMDKRAFSPELKVLGLYDYRQGHSA